MKIDVDFRIKIGIPGCLDRLHIMTIKRIVEFEIPKDVQAALLMLKKHDANLEIIFSASSAETVYKVEAT